MKMMMWVLLSLGSIIVLTGMAMWLRFHNWRVMATVWIPSSGDARVNFHPMNPSGEDLIGLLLAYGAKLRWVLATEPLDIQDAFTDAIHEITEAWKNGGPSLLRRMPLAAIVANQTDVPRAATATERFVVKYYRRDYKTCASVTSIINTLPRPGLAFNLVWNYVLIADAIYMRLDEFGKDGGKRALNTWQERILAPGNVNPSQEHLRRLLTEATFAWESAVRPLHKKLRNYGKQSTPAQASAPPQSRFDEKTSGRVSPSPNELGISGPALQKDVWLQIIANHSGADAFIRSFEIGDQVFCFNTLDRVESNGAKLLREIVRESFADAPDSSPFTPWRSGLAVVRQGRIVAQITICEGI